MPRRSKVYNSGTWGVVGQVTGRVSLKQHVPTPHTHHARTHARGGGWDIIIQAAHAGEAWIASRSQAILAESAPQATWSSDTRNAI
eukprot:111315-Amphidinium_carterae.1